MTISPYTVSAIARITGGKLFTRSNEDPEVRDLLIDSRRLVQAGGTLFVALVSARNDGHRYIEELAGKGVGCFLVNGSAYSVIRKFTRPPSHLSARPLHFILVTDTLAALQSLAAYHRSQFTIPVVGITGSNGKTIVKEWLFQLLSPGCKVIRSPKSYNSQVGVPLSVWKMEPGHNLALFEAGISRPGEMEKLEPIIRPTIGVLTNIGSAHDEQFSDRREKLEEKMKLFRNAELLIYCSDQPAVHEQINTNPAYRHLKTFTWAMNRQADLTVQKTEKQDGMTRLECRYGDTILPLKVPFTDDASIENAMHCMAVCMALEKPFAPDASLLAQRISCLAPIAMRLELKEAINHCSLINDSYNSDFNSLGIALDFMNQQHHNKRNTLILSDMLQTGRTGEELYRAIAQLLEQKGINRLIGIGPEISAWSSIFPMESHFFPGTDAFLDHFPISEFQHETILVKGARIFEFERISHLLQQKHHETVLEINLDAVVHNLNHYRSKLHPDTRLMVMVKAFSYGSGSFEIANVLQYHHVDYLAVACADEGVELRKSGIRLPILVMSPEEQSLDSLLRYNLEPEIYNLRLLDQLEEVVVRNQISGQEAVRIHIKLDTGMHRLGFTEPELGQLIQRLKRSPGLYVQSVFSHLAASEDPAEDEFTRLQIERFRKMSALLVQTIDHPVMLHILNSAGISRFPEASFDMARLGIGLYGVDPTAVENGRLRNVTTLRTVITQIKKIPKGDTIGYNRRSRATRNMTIAIIPVGYADGLDRRLGNGRGKVILHGEPVPVTGNICMDLTMIDISQFVNKGVEIHEGDTVIVFGDAQPVADLSRMAGTIPYEIMTGISRRVKRVYFYE